MKKAISIFVLVVLLVLAAYFYFSSSIKGSQKKWIAAELESNYFLNWFHKKYNVEIKLINSGQTGTRVGEKTIYLRSDLPKSETIYCLYFETGHLVYTYRWCPYAAEEHRLVCQISLFSPADVKLRYFVQTHLFAKRFVDSKGRLGIDPLYEKDPVEEIENYDLASQEVQLYMKMFEEEWESNGKSSK